MNKKLLSAIKDEFSLLELDSPFATTESGESDYDIKNYFLDIKFFKTLSILSKRFFTLD